MSPKRMRITNVSDNIVQLRGYGYDGMGTSFADYGVVLLIENEEIGSRAPVKYVRPKHKYSLS